MHGRLSAEEKESVMQDFQRGKTQVLVATSVVEVGIDVPNVTLMTIEDGDRFGLAQLHQMRGRVSRGVHPGFVCVFADTKTDQARERLEAFCNSNDGFELAEIDFRLRGPGSLFSLQQHGLPAFRIADLLRDADVVSEARRDAQALVGDGSLLRQLNGISPILFGPVIAHRVAAEETGGKPDVRARPGTVGMAGGAGNSDRQAVRKNGRHATGFRSR